MHKRETAAFDDSVDDLSGCDVLRIGRYVVEPATGRVSRCGRSVRLEPRAMGVLMYLAARQGCVISTRTLKEDVWGRVHIVDAAVKRCISQVRKAFGDDPADPSIIETVPKRGYRLIATVNARGRGHWQRPALRAIAIAASVFLVLAATLTLSALRQPAPGALDEADLHAIARTQYHRYDEPGMAAAARIYDRLLEIDPRDAAALAGLADTLMQQYLRFTPDEALALRAREVALRSISIDETQADAYKALGAYHHFRGEPDQAMKYYGTAVSIDPGYWTALNNVAEILRDSGHYEAASDWFQCALAVTPRKFDVLMQLVDVEARAGNGGSAESYLAIATLLNPASEDAIAALARLRRGDLPFPDDADAELPQAAAGDLRHYIDAPCDTEASPLLAASLP